MKKRTGIFTVFTIIGLLSAPVFAARNDGCDGGDKDNYINPTVALCSVHAYNVGLSENPTTAAERQYMNEVVALKTTIITQQMKKQYDFLETTVRRFKTQLQKAVLVSKMEAAGAAVAEATGAANTGRSKNIVIPTAQDCQTKTSTTEILTCLQSNARLTSNEALNGNTTNARKQLEADMSIYNLLYPNNKINVEVAECKSLSARNNIKDCADKFVVKAMQAVESQRNSSAARQQGTNYQIGAGQGSY